jgi:hypothetical protein
MSSQGVPITPPAQAGVVLVRPGPFAEAPAASGWLLVPRCAYRLEILPDGFQLFADCEDTTQRSMLQNLCLALAGGLVSLQCSLQGMLVWSVSLPVGLSKTEITEGGIRITSTANNGDLVALLHGSCEMFRLSLRAGLSAYLLINSTPVCMGTVLASSVSEQTTEPPRSGEVEPLRAEIGRLTQVVARLTDHANRTADINRLTQMVSNLSAERDAYRAAAQAWAAAQVTEADIQRYAQEEPGLPLEAFIGELEQQGRGS